MRFSVVLRWENDSPGNDFSDTEINAIDWQRAAEKAVQQYEWRMAEFPCASGTESIIATATRDDGVAETFRVMGETVPMYSAQRITT